MQIYRKIKYGFRSLIAKLRIYEGNPHKIALGVSIGVFVGATPTFPFHTVIALALAMLLKGSRIAAAAGVWISNPVTLPLFYIASYKTGAFFLGQAAIVDISQQSIFELVETGVDITHAMFLGSILIGFVLSVAAYPITLRIMAVLRSRRLAAG